METDNKKLVNIYLEANPNPNSMKFVTNILFFEDGVSYDFPDVASAAQAPLAQALFGFDFVDRVFYMSNFITVTKKEDIEWIQIKDQIKDLIKSHLEEEKPLLTGDFEETPDIDENDSELVKKIKGMLDEYVRPAVEQDGGAISFHSFNEGVVRVNLQGSCSGCPSSMVTLKAGIESLLKRMIPEVKEVEAVGI